MDRNPKLIESAIMRYRTHRFYTFAGFNMEYDNIFVHYKDIRFNFEKLCKTSGKFILPDNRTIKYFRLKSSLKELEKALEDKVKRMFKTGLLDADLKEQKGIFEHKVKKEIAKNPFARAI